ncbi:uncharacterized protein E0L32_007725 [Thyridium curvatum]|uniref:Uncharacterized protein n=1 Tax=Thyridium curvatum TaxID=1093900 RepID=A0A507AYI1_9PEZI|nr:uncharacterized protein E0L32_007725 [Thyridium curvatum]TPX11514.1 hypothetical protein E0L32_007725 [Thyridium curvatum]
MKSEALARVASACITAVLAAQPYSTWMTDSIMAINVPKTRYYTEATFYRGVEYVYNATHDEKYKWYLSSQIDAILTDNGSFVNWNPNSRQLDSIRVGETLLFLWGQMGEERYRNAIAFLHDELLAQKRTDEVAFWHKDPEYPNQQWLDGLFMGDTFYAHYTALFEPTNQTAWDDIVLQFDLMEKHCRDPKTGLLFHGYDQSHQREWADPVTGASPHLWDRGIGWYFMALLDVLDWLPQSHPGYEKLVNYFTSLAKALRKSWDCKQGGWWLVMDAPYPGMKGNYIESSGTAMFVTGFLKGMRKGFISRKEYEKFTLKAYDIMAAKFVGRNETSGALTWEGTVKVGSLSGNATYEYYIDQPIQRNMLNGVGPFIYASAEIEALRGQLQM